MDTKNFRLWMENSKTYHTARTYAARCLRVENAFGVDLDDQYLADHGISLLHQLKYSRKDSRDGIQPPHGIIFNNNADTYSGMHSLRAAVKKYFEYLQLCEKYTHAKSENKNKE